MPRITVKIPNSYESITQQVVRTVSQDVMRVTDIDPEKTKLTILGEFNTKIQTGTTLNDRREDVTFGGDSRISVTVDDTLKNDSILNQHVRDNQNFPILYDTELGIGVSPIYVDSELTLTFKYVAASRTEAIKWRDEFAIRRAENRTALYHSLLFYMPVQDGILEALIHFHTLKEKVAGYGESFPEYIERIKKRELTVQGTQDKDIKKSILAVPEKQVQVTGYFDFSDIPKESKVDGTTTWEIEWSYKVLYKRATHFYLTYPIAIHQQHISRDYFSDRKKYSLEEVKKGYSGLAVKAMDILDGYFESFPELAGGVRYPEYDDWIPDHKAQPAYTAPQFTWLTSLSKETTKLFDLNNLPNVRLTVEMEKYLRECHTVLNRRGHSVVHLTIFKDNRPMDDRSFYVDENLVLHSIHPIDLRSTYRVRFSLITRRFVLTDSAINLMKLHPEAILQAFQSLEPDLDVEWAMTDLLAGKYLKTGYIDWFYKYLENTNINSEQRSDLGNLSDGNDLIYHPGQGTGSDPVGPDGGRPENESQGRWSKHYKSGSKYVQMLAFVTKR